MASVKFGGGIVGMAGKIAGNVFARNRSGSYVRSWAKPVNTNTEAQTKIRAVTAALFTLWNSTLTAAQRLAWSQYAAGVTMVNRLGESMNLSGYNQFVRSNACRLYNDITAVLPGPTLLALPEKDTTAVATVTAATKAVSLAFDDEMEWLDETGGALVVYSGQPQNANVNFFNGPWHLCGKVLGNNTTPPTTPAAMTLPWEVADGQKCFFRARIMRADGRLSEFFRFESTAG
jgi:hypothetical protein